MPPHPEATIRSVVPGPTESDVEGKEMGAVQMESACDSYKTSSLYKDALTRRLVRDNWCFGRFDRLDTSSAAEHAACSLCKSLQACVRESAHLHADVRVMIRHKHKPPSGRYARVCRPIDAKILLIEMRPFREQASHTQRHI